MQANANHLTTQFGFGTQLPFNFQPAGSPRPSQIPFPDISSSPRREPEAQTYNLLAMLGIPPHPDQLAASPPAATQVQPSAHPAGLPLNKNLFQKTSPAAPAQQETHEKTDGPVDVPGKFPSQSEAQNMLSPFSRLV